MSVLARSVCLVIMAVACGVVAPGAGAAVNGNPGSHHEFYERAARYFSENAYAEAIIELRNALQRSPGHVPSRVLLGRAYLYTGDTSAAEKELTLALSYGADETLVLVPLGNALLLQRRHEEILKRIRSLDPVFDASGEILSIRGQALLELGRLEEAETAFRSAVWAAPDQADPLLGLASVLMARGNREEAEELVEQAGRIAPDNEEVWFRKAQARLLVNDDAAAVELLDRVIARRPGHLRARLARAGVRMSLGQLEGAREDADYILAKQPDDPHATLLAAQAYARLGSGEEARAALDRAAELLETVDPDFLWRNPAALNLAGKVSFVQGNFEKVNIYLTRYLSLRPQGSALARKLLARARIEIGNPDGAVDVLDPLVRERPDDVEALLLLGDAHLRAKHYLQAADVLERASALAENDARVRTRLALGRIGSGRTVDALASLDDAFALDPGSLRTGLLLTFLQLRRGEVEAASATASALAARYPENPLIVNLSGVVLRSMGRADEAREAFNRSLSLDPGFTPALFNLADLERRAGNTEGAASHYHHVLEIEPRSARAYIGLSDLEREAGRLYEAVDLLKKAQALAPDAKQPYLRLIEHSLSLNDVPEALRTARELADRHPQDSQVLEQLARTEIAAGNRAAAVRTLGEASRYASYSGSVLLRIGRSQASMGDYEGARWSFAKAVDTDRHDEANVALSDLFQKSGDMAGALEFSTELLAREPGSAVAHSIHAGVLAKHGRLAESIEAYERSLTLAPTSAAMVGLFEVLVTTGQQQRGIERLEDWISRYPQDLIVSRALALGYIAANRLDEALALHEQLLRQTPDDPLMLNNLARIFQIKNDPRALEYGERAVAIAPTWPIALDTLGWIHVADGRPEQGLRLLRDAHARDARNPVIRYHLALALRDLGRSKEAIAQLDYLITTQGRLAWIGEVRSVRDALAAQ